MNAPTPPPFTLIRRQAVPSLKLEVEEYRHTVTGAQHIHIAADHPENVFLVALRTVPKDSRGVAHILEHTALCGSEKYPVRDPFFMMIRRSLNTFMNAFTSSDWTAYPFASQNRKDFDNLLDVYLDAVFFSRLDELDFAQEGHRLEFAEPNNPATPLVYKGVVYNEMKGAMSSVASTLWHTLCNYLYPTTTYHHNSGGDPQCIPDLTYQQLLHFYKTHYHPSNAIFMTFGDIPAQEHQTKFQARVLSRYDFLDATIAVPDEKRYFAPVRVEQSYPLSEDEDSTHKTHIVIAWLLGKVTDLRSQMQAHLLNSILLDHSASPLLMALETTELGSSPSPLCGLDDSQKEMCFVCGIEGSEPDRAEALEALVLDVVRDVAAQGVPLEQVQAALHQLELQQREIGGDGYPYGLQLILSALTNATHRGDPVAALDLEPVLAELREQIKNPDFIKQLARDLLVNNPHRVRLTLRPDKELNQRREAAEISHLAAVKEALSDQQKQAIIERATQLAERQARRDDESILPKVGLEDVAATMAYVAPEGVSDTPLRVTRYGVGTNGLVYQQLILPLPALSPAQLDLLPIYTTCLTELGVGQRDYLATQVWQSQVSGGLNAYASAHSAPDSVASVGAYLVLSGKGLVDHQPALTELMAQTLSAARFDELPRLRELVAQTRARREMSVTGSGHQLAMSAAASGVGPGAMLGHRWGGLEGIRLLKQLDTSLNDTVELERMAQSLHGIHQAVLGMSRQCLLVAEQEHLSACQTAILDAVAHNASAQGPVFSLTQDPHQVGQLWKTNTQVNFCARAYPTVPMDHVDAAPLNVLGGFLRNGYLHRAIREQGGAYGGGAGQDNGIGAFRFFSYRDPRLEETLRDFDQALDWLHNEQHPWQQVEEAILGVIAGIDKPGSPAGEAKQTFHAELSGRTRARREQFRKRVTEVTLDDLQRVAHTYLRSDRASTAVITHPDRVAGLAHLQLQVYAL